MGRQQNLWGSKKFDFKKRPLFWIAVFLTAGILAGYYFEGVHINIALFLITVTGAGLLFGSNKSVLCCVLAAAAGFCLITVHEVRYEHPQAVHNWNDRETVEVIGEIRHDLESIAGDYLYLDPLTIEGTEVSHGLIRIPRAEPGISENGALLRVPLRLFYPARQRNPGSFCYRTYLKRQGVYSQGRVAGAPQLLDQKSYPLKDRIIKIKKKLLGVLDSLLEKPYREVMKALLLGERDNLPPEWEQYFSGAGANHLLAISGLHVGFITLFLFMGARLVGCPELGRNILISIFMLIYILITGGRSSVIRAGLLAVLFMWAPYFNRKADLFNILGLTAVLTLFINPHELFNPGFQLTYLVIITIVRWTGYLKDMLFDFLPDLLSVSLAAQLGSVMITAYYFNIITPVALLTNLWAVPFTGLLVGGGFLLLILGTILGQSVLILARIQQLMLEIFRIGMEVMGTLPGAQLEVGSPRVLVIVLYYGFLFYFSFLLPTRVIPRKQKIKSKKIKTAVIIVIIICFSGYLISVTGSSLEIIVFDVGQGDSILLSLPGGEQVLIDGGERRNGLDKGRDVLLPYFKNQGIDYLDLVFVSHFHSDHAGGLKTVMEEREVGLLVVPEGFRPGSYPEKILAAARRTETPVRYAGRSDSLQIGEVKLKILHPKGDKDYPDRNNNSLVKRVVYKDFAMLLTGDLEEYGEQELVGVKGSFLRSHILKVGHHGSNSSSTEKFLQAVASREGIISVGENNRYGHPDQEVLDRLRENNIRKWRTDRQGAVIIETDGRSYSIEGFLPP